MTEDFDLWKVTFKRYYVKIQLKAESVIWLFLKINLSTTISMKRSHREFSIDMVIHTGIIQNNRTQLFLCFIIPKTEIKLGFFLPWTEK